MAREAAASAVAAGAVIRGEERGGRSGGVGYGEESGSVEMGLSVGGMAGGNSGAGGGAGSDRARGDAWGAAARGGGDTRGAAPTPRRGAVAEMEMGSRRGRRSLPTGEALYCERACQRGMGMMVRSLRAGERAQLAGMHGVGRCPRVEVLLGSGGTHGCSRGIWARIVGCLVERFRPETTPSYSRSVSWCSLLRCSLDYLGYHLEIGRSTSILQAHSDGPI